MNCRHASGRVFAFVQDKMIDEKTKKKILDQVNKTLLNNRGFMQKLGDQAKHVADNAREFERTKRYANAGNTGQHATSLFDAISNWLNQ